MEIGHGNAGLIPWSAFSDVTEPVPELAWPQSITTYSAMRTDAQVASSMLAFTLPSAGTGGTSTRTAHGMRWSKRLLTT
jgi:hypothetical protein